LAGLALQLQLLEHGARENAGLGHAGILQHEVDVALQIAWVHAT